MARAIDKRWMVAAVIAMAAGLQACSAEYLARRDSLTLGAGDAKAHNIAVQMVDPWSRRAFDTHVPTHGAAAEAAMKSYRDGMAAQNGGSAAVSPASVANSSPTISTQN